MEKNYLFGFYLNQKALIDNDIKLSTDAILVLYTMLSSSETPVYKNQSKVLGTNIYYWFAHLEVAKQLPIIFYTQEFSDRIIKQKVYRVIKELIAQDLVNSYQNTQIEQKTYYCFTKKGLKFWADSREIPLLKNAQAPYSKMSKPLLKNDEQLEDYRLETLNKFKEQNCDFALDSLNLPAGLAGSWELGDPKEFLTSRQNISGLKTVAQLESVAKGIYLSNSYLLGEVITEVNKLIAVKAQDRTTQEIISWVSYSWAKYFLIKNTYKAPIASRKNPTNADIHNSIICMLGNCIGELQKLFTKDLVVVHKKSETDIFMDKLNKQLKK